MKTMDSNGKFIVYLEGRIDSNSSAAVLAEIQESIKSREDSKIELNMEKVGYVSSAGLRSFLKLKKDGTDFCLTDVSSEVYDIFSVTGFTELLDIRKALRTMSVDGCEIIGKGFYGTVYRIDEDTIVKVYDSPDSIPMIENEQRRAKQAFLKGIPTAISYDVVKVGGSYGSVFEMLKAKTLNDQFIEETDKIDENIKMYVEFIKLVHGTVMDTDSLPYAADLFVGYLDTVKKYLTDDQYETMRGYLKAFPKDDHVVHGDFHMKNIMMVEGEPMLIDMDTLSAGHPIFDLAGLYATYCAFQEDEPDNTDKFLGITGETAYRVWDGIMNIYFGDVTDEERDMIEAKIKLAAMIRFLFIIEVSHLKDEALGPVRIAHIKEHFAELLDKVDGMYFEVSR